jgi:predicted nucleotidyltransferase
MDRPLNAHHAAALRDFVARVRAGLGAHLVDLRLFGSVARGDDTPESDIDVFVVVQPEDRRVTLENQIIDIAFDVNLAHDVYISPRVLSSDTLNDPVWRETPFLEAVMHEGIPL